SVEQVAVVVNAEGLLELFLRSVFRGLLLVLLARIVHEDVDRSEAAGRLLDRPPAELRVRDIAADQQALGAFGFDQALRVLGVPVLIEIDDRDRRTLPREMHGHGPTDAAVAAADDRHLALELAAAAIVVADRHRLGGHCGLHARLSPLLLPGLRSSLLVRHEAPRMR